VINNGNQRTWKTDVSFLFFEGMESKKYGKWARLFNGMIGIAYNTQDYKETLNAAR
jgi:ATP-dependent exoDNAse (exonuclease V) alpha subunit